MESKFLQSYIEDNKTLAKTLVIKSEIASELLNDRIKLVYGASAVDDSDPTSWKYYRNISGSYHSLDQAMVITSLDTLEEIVFDRDNLAVHTETAKAYQFGSRYYYNLLAQYPEQEQLILGILYPCDLEAAVAAEDGSILSYPSYLVEEQEISLIQELEQFIKQHNSRWNLPAYGLTDSLYPLAYHAILYLNILPKLLNLRLKRCKTHEAHSFHIREYLASHLKLDSYIPYMTTKQKMWLYRNIRYIFRNSGKAEQFKLLMTKLLTERRIPLNEFSVRHKGSFDAEYLPELLVRRKELNNGVNAPERDYLTMDDLFELEQPLVYGNPDYLTVYEDQILLSLKLSLSNAIQTKELESNMIDYNDAVPVTLESVLLSLWVMMASNGLYDVIVNFKEPRTSNTISLYALDAFIYMYYITLRAFGIPNDPIPEYFNVRSHRLPLPTVNEMLAVTDQSFTALPELAQQLLAAQPAITPKHSTLHFFELGYALYQEELKHWFLISATQDLYERALVDNMILTLYEDRSVVLTASPTLFSEWLVQHNLTTYDYTPEEAQMLLRNIFTAATGLVIDNSKKLANIQKAMVAIMAKLSSYSVEFITKINDSGIKPLNWAALRLGNFQIGTEHYQHVDNEIVVNGVDTQTANNYTIENTDKGVEINYSVSTSNELEIELVTYCFKEQSEMIDIPMYFNSFYLEADYPEKDPEISKYANSIGWEYYLMLSDAQKKQLKSIY